MSSERKGPIGQSAPKTRSEPEPAARGPAAPAQSPAAQPPGQGLLPAITLPKGGGAIRGLGEKFSTNPATGTASLSIPIATSPGRAGFELGLALGYDSGSGNGPFGLGWHLSTPAITRKTDKGLPRYADDAGPDVFVLSGAEDLVPVRRADGSLEASDRNGFRVQRFRPRTEGLFARIERWTRALDGDVHWRAITPDNVLNVYGRSETARIADSEAPRKGRDARVFSWLLEETRDDRGNIARYTYKAEDQAGVDPSKASESNRCVRAANGTTTFLATAQRYLKRIEYGNRTPVADRAAPAPPANDPARPTREAHWLFEVVFDYGEHDKEAPTPDEVTPWLLRADPFSSYRATFEVRTYRCCRRVLMFHWFAELGDSPCLVRSTDFTYEPDLWAGDRADWPTITYLTSATQVGYKRKPGSATYDRLALPPLQLGYARPDELFSEELQTLDRQSLDGITSGVESAGGQWVDLDGEGIPGVLLPTERAWYYKENLGGGKLAPPRLELELPWPAQFARGAQQLSDLGGDGNLDLLSYGPPLPGYFERSPESKWRPLVPLAQVPHIDWQDPNLRFLDLDGDGHADILITEDDAFVWYRSRGKDGFEPAAFAAKPKDEQNGAAVVFADGTETIQLADMSGDGLTDIVRIRNGEVSYWPNLGFGHFGRKVTLDGSPLFDSPDQFDPKRIRLADIDGSGTTDIIYLGRQGIRLYFNQSGNSLAQVKSLTSLPPVDSAASLSVVDLLGNGTACLVWCSPLGASQSRPLVYVDLMGGKKPHLLESVVNNFGAERRIGYASSTRFYLADKEAGRPWLTRLAFPVHVVARIEQVDHVANSKLVTTFAYHHGYFDGHEREFRGFARVEQWDAESFSGEKGRGLFPELPYDADPRDPDLNLPPVRTVTWFHTGAWLERERLESALAREYYAGDPMAPLLPDTPRLAGLSLAEEREAVRALRGQILRQEIYAEDFSEQASHPYVVSERSYQVRTIQAPDGELHGVFFVHPSQTLNLHYERQAHDPRIQHEVVLAVDDFGQVTKSAAIAYPRRDAERQREEQKVGRDLGQQNRAWATLAEHRFADRPNEADWYRASVPVETKTSELVDLQVSAAGLVDVEALGGSGTATRQGLVECEQRFYYDEHANLGEYRDDEQGLPLGEITQRALLHHSERVAFSVPFVAETYGDRVDDAILKSAGYVLRDGAWWAASGRAVYDSARFFMAVEAVDPFGNWTAVDYDAYSLLPVASKEPRVQGDAGSGLVETTDQRLGSILLAEPDYRVLAPWRATDANRNSTEAVFNALGLPEETWRKAGPGNAGGDHDCASVYFRYGLDAWVKERTPAWSHSARRTEHDQGGTPFAPEDGKERLDRPTRAGFLHSRVYTDGSGREAMTKVMAEAGPVPIFDTGTGHIERNADGTPKMRHVEDRWVGTGRTVFDNKGNPVKKYEPFFADTIAYQDEKELVEWGVTPIFRYDPLGRLVRTHQPNGTFSLVDFDAWTTRTWDENDTVKDSPWYAGRGSPDPDHEAEPTRNPSRRAAWLAAQHAGTFATAHLDALGRTFSSVADNGPAGKYETRFELDIKGNQLELSDPRGVLAFQQDFDLLSRKLHTISADAGESRVLLDVTDKPVRAWQPRGIELRHEYDSLHRPTSLFVTDPERGTILAEHVLYGELHGQAERNSLRGRPHRLYDGAGVVSNEAFDCKGNLLLTRRTLARNYEGGLDWAVLCGQPWLAAVESEAAALLEDEAFETSATYDAIDRVTSQTTPDGKVTTPTYNQANLLESVAVDEEPYVANIDYNARGQRLSIEYGNGAVTQYTYDNDTFRLQRQVSTRPSSGDVQDLSYEYDPVGNITQMIDRVSFGRPAHAADVAPEDDFQLRLAAAYGDRVFAYDATYQLALARGRHHSGQQVDACDRENATFVHPNDPQGLVPYLQTFSYDEAGNISEMACRTTTNNGMRWARTYTYAADSNQLLFTSVPGAAADASLVSYRHDDAGNMIQMPHLPRMAWDYANRLVGVEKQVTGDPSKTNPVFFTYDAAGQRVRKVYQHDGMVEERIYLGAYEIYRKRADSAPAPDFERQTLHVMDGQHCVALLETKTVEDGVGRPDATARIRYQIEDHLLSSTMELDRDGEPFSYEEHYPYGETSFRASNGSFDESPKRYRYSGKERDEETGLYYYGARYYVAWLGRWCSCDPASSHSSRESLYLFASCNPLAYVDPDGYSPEEPDSVGPRCLNAQEALEAAESLDEDLSVVKPKGLSGDAQNGPSVEELNSVRAAGRWVIYNVGNGNISQSDVRVEGVRDVVTLQVSNTTGNLEWAAGQAITQRQLGQARIAYARLLDNLAEPPRQPKTWDLSEYFADDEPGVAESSEIANGSPSRGGGSSGGARGYVTSDLLYGDPVTGTLLLGSGPFVLLMVYTQMKEAELRAEEEDSFKPIEHEAKRQVGALAGSILAGALVGLPAGPMGIIVGVCVGAAGGMLGYALVGSSIQHQEKMESDPEYRKAFEAKQLREQERRMDRR